MEKQLVLILTVFGKMYLGMEGEFDATDMMLKTPVEVVMQLQQAGNGMKMGFGVLPMPLFPAIGIDEPIIMRREKFQDHVNEPLWKDLYAKYQAYEEDLVKSRIGLV